MKTLKAQTLSKPRNAVDKSAVEAFHWELSQSISLVDMDPSRVFNLDETSFSPTKSSRKVDVQRTSKDVFVEEAPASAHVTIVACVSVTGTKIPPLFVLPGDRVSTEACDSLTIPGAAIMTSEKGWTNSLMCRKWMSMLSASIPSFVARSVFIYQWIFVQWVVSPIVGQDAVSAVDFKPAEVDDEAVQASWLQRIDLVRTQLLLLPPEKKRKNVTRKTLTVSGKFITAEYHELLQAQSAAKPKRKKKADQVAAVEMDNSEYSQRRFFYQIDNSIGEFQLEISTLIKYSQSRKLFCVNAINVTLASSMLLEHRLLRAWDLLTAPDITLAVPARGSAVSHTKTSNALVTMGTRVAIV
ncbi:hypothetical protein DYB37_012922 [Aphanomyces astaci]|uniref:DDE-1 domain-containing protein n=1 Tax=Aphanomyces astaci TaxID=112090 RepID=A0A418FNP3_APHAT|nr:hypothetical protein DYB37_012922 [Aphanomyces astaci]